MKSFAVMLLAFLFAIVHVTDGAVARGSSASTQFLEEIQELQAANVVFEGRKLKGGMMKGGGTTITRPVVAPRPVVECEGCCCSLRDGVTKCCGKTCANKILCL